ncbi:MFS transporter [Vibrio sp. SCSIO 43136]|uniref:MFS transporter n=1 Tax=Vibrio sp. SCSIO 43136 TaxID=2819101 RepID=UPI0020760A65|nr:MFS transporter [Vibrio sp. SCSIO 43136]USD67683.1 MFS transporter [Vibrio sp. SCSIO 43136]
MSPWLVASIKLAIAAHVFSILPSYLTVLEQLLDISSINLSYLAATELMGFAAACAINFFSLRKGVKISDNVALMLLTLCNLASAVAVSLPWFFTLRFAAGICAGLVVVRCYEVLSAQSNPDVAFGRALAVQMVSTMLSFILIAPMVENYGPRSFMWVLALSSGLAFLLLPVSRIKGATKKIHNQVNFPIVLLSLSAIGLVMLTHSAVWSVLGNYASLHDVPIEQQGLVFAIGTLFSIGGAMLATYSFVLQRKLTFLSIAIALQALMFVLMLTETVKPVFILASFAFQLLWNFMTPLVMGSLARGKYAFVVIRFTLAAQTLGAALGPLMLAPNAVMPEVLIMLAITYVLVLAIVHPGVSRRLLSH